MDRDTVVNALNVLWGWVNWIDQVWQMVGTGQLKPIGEMKDAIAAIKAECAKVVGDI